MVWVGAVKGRTKRWMNVGRDIKLLEGFGVARMGVMRMKVRKGRVGRYVLS
jgi:hypothetical protein